MTSRKANLQTILQDNGYSVTKQRLFVFALLCNQEPLTMHELTKRALGSLDRASLYRIISVFEQIGVVQRINIGWKYKIELSDTFAEHHHHLTCVQCGKVTDINGDKLESFIDQLAAEHTFIVLEHQVELQGHCNQCAASARLSY